LFLTKNPIPPERRFNLSSVPAFEVKPMSAVNLTCVSQNKHAWMSTAPQFEDGFKHNLRVLH
jgi:hypothetical protein